MPIPQEKKLCGMGILPVLVIFARGLFNLFHPDFIFICKTEM
ncbi:hypothetical protein QUB70_03720 [Microcoleus sp. A003_D6]